MRANILVPMSLSQELRGDGQRQWFVSLVVSLGCHLVFFLLFAIAPGLRFESPPTQSVINVSMVSLKQPDAAVADAPAVANKAPKIEKPEAVKKPTVAAPVEKKADKVVPKPSKPKTSLKKKTFQATQVVKQAIQQLEARATEETDAKPSAAEPEALKSALERLRQEVGKVEADRPADSAKTADQASGKATGRPGLFDKDGKQTAQLVDLYRLEVAFQIQKNWAFNEQLAGGDRSLVAAIVFKVMPDGEIRDIFFTDRSGNDYLDESAYKAIVKANPVDKHPDGLAQPFVVMAIRFTPQGIR